MITVLKYAPNSSPLAIADFIQESDAKLFIDEKYHWEKAMQVTRAIYKTSSKNQATTFALRVLTLSRDKTCKTLGYFRTKADAKLFLQARLDNDTAHKQPVTTYQLVDGESIITEKTTQDAIEAATSDQRFSPTPLPTAPRPPGTPPIIWEDEED